MEVEKEPSFKLHMPLEPRLNRVCVLEDLDFWWDEWELKDIKKMWKMELSINYMAEHFDRDPDEVILAIIHLAREEKIIRRKSGLLNL
jgi:hypothetical protein